MFWNKLPWRFLLRKLAIKQGFLDPIALLGKLSAFGQKSEVSAPVELLRAGAVFHARGFLNSKVIQNNLDWVWPYWVHKQFNPKDQSFLPRAFSLSHVNLTNRSWTAVGYPGCTIYPVVDPRGLITPFHDSWSIDFWVMDYCGNMLFPSKAKNAVQRLDADSESYRVHTTIGNSTMSLMSTVEVVLRDGMPVCSVKIKASSKYSGYLVVAVRPFNPEGVSEISGIELGGDRKEIRINKQKVIRLDESPQKNVIGNYEKGDVVRDLKEASSSDEVACRAGMATMALCYPVADEEEKEFGLSVPLDADTDRKPALAVNAKTESWQRELEACPDLEIPDKRMQRIYKGALSSLVLFSPREVYPGPFTYKRFWFRDACLILNAMLAAGMEDRVLNCIEEFQPRQTIAGYFLSQEGEWDSNGQVLWLLQRIHNQSGKLSMDKWVRSVVRAAEWIIRKREDPNIPNLHAGLMPAGFSAEHLGNNDYYYWDDYWSAAGLKSAGLLLKEWGDDKRAERYFGAYGEMMKSIDVSLGKSLDIRKTTAIPASPYRRMDSGAIGSLAASFPLNLYKAKDERIAKTVKFLRNQSFVDGMFFQEMIHSGKNAYLSLHVAQVMMRDGEEDFFDIVKEVSEISSQTGQWPEANHPLTGGGCMGDGHHVWASAEWVNMIHAMFVREDKQTVVLGSGIPREWQKSPARINGVRIPAGRLDVSCRPDDQNGLQVSWKGEWRHCPERMIVAVPGREVREFEEPPSEGHVTLAHSVKPSGGNP